MVLILLTIEDFLAPALSRFPLPLPPHAGAFFRHGLYEECLP